MNPNVKKSTKKSEEEILDIEIKTTEIDKKDGDDSGFNDHHEDEKRIPLNESSTHNCDKKVIIVPGGVGSNCEKFNKNNHNGDGNSNNVLVISRELPLDDCFKGQVLINNTNLVTL